MNEAENTKIVQECYEKFGTGDIEGLLANVHENVNWNTPAIPNAGFTGKRAGTKAVREFFTQMAEAESFTRFEPLEFIAEGDKVVVLGEFAAKVKATGNDFESEWAHIFHLHDGKITEFKEFYDTAKATKAYQMTAKA